MPKKKVEEPEVEETSEVQEEENKQADAAGDETTENKAPEVTEEEYSNRNGDAGEEIVKSGFRKVKVKDFRGSYADAKFDDNGVCAEISEKTLEELKAQFPGAEFEEID